MTVDVLIPTHNSDKEYLRACLESLVAQTHTNWQCCIHDDSKEDIRPMISDFLEDPRFTYIHTDDTLTIGGNWNACLKNTSGDIVAYLFQDDTWEPHYLESALQVFEAHPEIGLVSMGHVYDIETEIITANDYRKLEAMRELMSGGVYDGRKYLQSWIDAGLRPNVIGEPDFVVLRRSLVEKAGQFHPTMRQCLDAEYWVRCLEHTDWYLLNGNYGSFRVHGDATTTKNREEGQGLFDAFQILQDFIDRTTDKEMRNFARAAQKKQFQIMAEKYMEKRDRGDRITSKGSSVLKSFCFRNPILAGTTLLKAFFTRA